MDLPLVMAALMNRWGEDILPGRSGLRHGGQATSTTGNAAFAAAAQAAAATPAGRHGWTFADLRAQIHDDCSVAVQVERRIAASATRRGCGWGCAALATMTP